MLHYYPYGPLFPKQDYNQFVDKHNSHLIFSHSNLKELFFKKDNLDHWDHQGNQDHWDHLAHKVIQASLAHLDSRERQDLKVQGDFLDSLDNWDQRVVKGLLEHQVKMVNLDHQGHLDHPAFQVSNTPV